MTCTTPFTWNAPETRALPLTAESQNKQRSRSVLAFSLLELLVTIVILALATATVAPMFGDDARLRVMAAAQLVASDIELAQTMSISYPDEPVVVRFDVANNRYWLAYASMPDEPLLQPNSGAPYLVVFGEGRAASARDVTILLDQVTDDMLQFDSSGGLTDFSVTPLIQLSLGGDAITLSIAPMTGTVRENEGAISDLKK